MPNPTDSVYPDPQRGAEQSFSNQSPETKPEGVELRTYMAIEFYKAILTRGARMTKKEMGFQAVHHADALIECLNEFPLPGSDKF